MAEKRIPKAYRYPQTARQTSTTCPSSLINQDCYSLKSPSSLHTLCETFTTAFLRLVIPPPARRHDERLSGLILAEVNYGIHH
ncbi:MAG: hypothetical protein ACR5LC_14725, partial [Symbiopectobacterium sp.]|uniref:hypothetical protein n=1 Tax=Symbiopectobacterium sp. TaxID=2952789 RepID=UPI003F39332A